MNNVDAVRNDLAAKLKNKTYAEMRKAYDYGNDPVNGFSLEDIVDSFAVGSGWRYTLIFRRGTEMYAMQCGFNSFDTNRLHKVKRRAVTVYKYDRV